MNDDENPLREASDLARAGRAREAISCLEAALIRTRPDAQRPVNTSLLARTAGLFCEQAGMLPHAASYYAEAVASGGHEPLTLVALADVRFRLGQGDEALACLASAESMARSSSDDDALEAVAATRMRWTGGRH